MGTLQDKKNNEINALKTRGTYLPFKTALTVVGSPRTRGTRMSGRWWSAITARGVAG